MPVKILKRIYGHGEGHITVVPNDQRSGVILEVSHHPLVLDPIAAKELNEAILDAVIQSQLRGKEDA